MGHLLSRSEPSVYGRNQNKIEELRIQINILNDTIDSINKIKDDAVNESVRLRVAAEHLNKTNDILELRILTLHKKEQNLAVQNGNQKSELIQTQKNLQKVKTEIQILDTQVNKFKSQNSNLENTLRKSQEEIQSLKEKNSALNDAIRVIDNITDGLEES